MSLTPKDKAWNLEIERRKKKIVEEELNLRSELANLKSMIIFSNILSILQQPVKFEDHLKKRSKVKLKKRSRYFLGKRLLLEDELKEPEEDAPIKKRNKEKEMIHVHIHQKMPIPKPQKELLETYRKHLNK